MDHEVALHNDYLDENNNLDMVDEDAELNIDFQDTLETRDQSGDSEDVKNLKKAFYLLEERVFHFLYCWAFMLMKHKYFSKDFLLDLHYDFILILQNIHYSEDALLYQPIPAEAMQFCQRMKEIFLNYANKIMALKEACEDNAWDLAITLAAEVARETSVNQIVFPFKYRNFLEGLRRNIIHFNPPSFESIGNACMEMGLKARKAVYSPLNRFSWTNNFLSGSLFLRFNIAKVKNNFNSGFRAISVLLTGTGRYHWQIRKMLTKELAKNSKIEYFGLMNTKESYQKLFGKLKRMKPRNIKHVKLSLNRDYMMALAIMANMNVVLISEKYGFQAHSPDEGFDSYKKDLPAIFIYFDGNHYCPIISSA